MYPDLSYVLHDIFGAQPDNWSALVKTYGVFLFLAIITAAKVFEAGIERNRLSGALFRGARHGQLPPRFINNVVIIVALSGLIGSKVIALLEHPGYLVSGNLVEAIFYKTGISFYGGLIFAGAALIYYFHRINVNIWPTLDAAAPALLVGYAIGRMGCHLSGDGDWGIVASAAPGGWFLPEWMWAFDFPHNVADKGLVIDGCTFKYNRVLTEAVFPTSLYECIISLGLFAGVLLLLKVRLYPGTVFSVYLMANGIERFLIEFIRVNQKYWTGIAWLSQAQMIAILLFFTGTALLLYLHYASSNHTSKAVLA